MNEKRWFIFNKDHHLGPFAEDEIRSRFHRGELTADSQLWSEGMAGWMAFRDITAFHRDAFPEKKEVPQWKKTLEEANKQLNAIEPERGKKIPPAPELIKVKSEEVFIDEESDDQEEETVEEITAEINVEELAIIEEEDELDMPPPLPPLPVEDEIENSPVEETLETSEFDEEELSEQTEVEQNQEATGEINVEEMNIEDSAPSPLRWWSSVVLVVVSLGLLIWTLLPARIENPFNDLTEAQRSVLTHFAKNAPDNAWMFKFHIDREKGKLYLASNKSESAKLTVRFYSIEKRTLSLEKSEFVGNVILEQNFGQARELTMISGTEISLGEYFVEVNGRAYGMRPRILNQLKAVPVFKDMKFVKSYSDEVIYRSQFLIFNGTPKQFDEKLNQFNQGLEIKRLMPLRDQLQRVLAIKAFLDGIKALFDDYINRITKGPSIAGFERKYNLEIGPALSEMVVDNNRLSIENMNTDKDLSSQYEILMNKGKAVAGVAADIVSSVRKVAKIKNSDRDRLKAKFEKQFKRLEEDLTTHAQSIENSIKNYTR